MHVFWMIIGGVLLLAVAVMAVAMLPALSAT
jgi:hypothetical protein